VNEKAWLDRGESGLDTKRQQQGREQTTIATNRAKWKKKSEANWPRRRKRKTKT